jgi:hypothetical protein
MNTIANIKVPFCGSLLLTAKTERDVELHVENIGLLKK